MSFSISNPPGPGDARHSGKVVDVSGASGAAGAPVIQWTNLGGPNQRFRLERLPEGFFRVLAKHSGNNQRWRHRAEVVIE